MASMFTCFWHTFAATPAWADWVSKFIQGGVWAKETSGKANAALANKMRENIKSVL
jgi:hypothetical protein